jgi:GWxTD domain-containing protein
MLSSGALSGQPEKGVRTERLSPRYWVDVLFFQAGSGEKTFTEVFVEVPYSTLNFVKPDVAEVTFTSTLAEAGPLTGEPAFQANVEISVLFDDPENPDGGQVVGTTISDTIRAATLDMTLSNQLTRTFYFAFQVKPGTRRIRVELIDKVTGQSLASTRQILVPSFKRPKLQLSSLQLARKIEISEDSSPLTKNGRTVYPNVQHAFGSDGPGLFAYFEAYNFLNSSSVTDSFRVHYRILRGRRVIRTLSRKYPKPGTSAALSVQLPIADLDLGDYLLTVTVEDQEGKRQASANAQFSVTKSWNYLSDKDFQRLVQQLAYIASAEELQTLRAVPNELRGAAIAQFWQHRDPTPGTPKNEAMEEFYRRVRYANDNFHSVEGEGWQSDRGRVYIVLGPPDRVSREPFKSGTPSEVWEYQSLQQKFVFVDQEGFGQYRLTKPFDAAKFSLWLPD